MKVFDINFELTSAVCEFMLQKVDERLKYISIMISAKLEQISFYNKEKRAG